MSLLEDVFLQDEAGEAQELERVIEGDEFDDQPRALSSNSDENSENEDEAEEDKRRVDPTKAKEKKIVRHPRFLLNPARLTGPRGIQVIPEHFKDFKFKGKGHEKEDLDLVLKKLEHWAYRLYPKFQFEDCLKKIETLGKKRPVLVHLHKIRTDQFQSEDTVVQQDSSDDEANPAPPQEEDEFDRLLQQQIELARATPAPGTARKGFDTPGPDRSTLMPKFTSSPSISEEQKERMLRNRRLAEERRVARLKQITTDNSVDQRHTENHDKVAAVNDVIDNTEEVVPKKNRSNVIDSSDDECDVSAVAEPVSVDIHENRVENIEKESEESSSGLKANTQINEEIILATALTYDVIEIDVPKVNKNDDASDAGCQVNKVTINNSVNDQDNTTHSDESLKFDTNCVLSNATKSTHADTITVRTNAETITDEFTEENNTRTASVPTLACKTDGDQTEHVELTTEVDRNESKQKSDDLDDELDIMDVDFSDDF